MRRRIGRICMVSGVILIFLAFALYFYNRWDANRAEEEAARIADLLDEQIEENRNSVSISGSDSGTTQDTGDEQDGVAVKEMDVIEIEGVKYIGTLSISRFGLELPVMSEWSYTGLKVAPGRYNGSVFSDDLVICGHNYERHFGNLKNLVQGDTIIFTDVNGDEYNYEVAEVTVLQPTDIDEMLSQETIEWDLTLFTCTYGGQARVTVRWLLFTGWGKQ